MSLEITMPRSLFTRVHCCTETMVYVLYRADVILIIRCWIPHQVANQIQIPIQIQEKLKAQLARMTPEEQQAYIRQQLPVLIRMQQQAVRQQQQQQQLQQRKQQQQKQQVQQPVQQQQQQQQQQQPVQQVQAIQAGKVPITVQVCMVTMETCSNVPPHP